MTDEQIQSLVQLKELKEQGILSQDEFEKAKTDLLSGTNSSQQVKRDTLDNPAAIPNTAIQEDKTIDRNGNKAKPIVKKEKSWFARNWEYIALAIAIALVKIVSKLA